MGTIEETLVHEIFIRYNLQVLGVDINVCCDNIQNVVGVHVTKMWPIFKYNIFFVDILLHWQYLYHYLTHYSSFISCIN